MAVPETGADSDQQRRRRPTATKGSWEGRAVFLLGVTVSFLIRTRLATIVSKIVSSCREFYMIWRKIYLGKRKNRDSGFTVACVSVAPVPL